MSGFDSGLAAAQQRYLERQRIGEQQRVQQQNTVGMQLLNSINNAKNIKPPTDPQTIIDETGKEVPNPVYATKKQNFDDAQANATKLMSQYSALNSPEQHASFAQHLHGLIFGMPTEHAQQPALSPNSAPVKPVADPNAPAPPPAPPDATAPGGGVSSPFAAPPADHPLHAITNGIKTLGNHLKAAANPIPPNPNPVDPALIAKYYRDPGAVAAERASTLEAQKAEENQKLWGIRGTTSIDVAKIRSQYQLLNTPEKARLDSGAKSLGYDNFPTAPPDVQDSLLKQYKTATRAPAKNIVVDPSSPTGYSAAEWDTGTGKPVSYFQGVLPPRGFVPTHKASTDAFGNTTISETTPEINKGNGAPLPPANPITSGMPTPPVSSAAPPAPNAAPTIVPTNPGARPPGTKPTGGAIKAQPISSAAPSVPSSQPAPLDADGHIPEGVGNPLVRQFANNLLDGQDSKDIPNPGARAAAERMASQYGWARGAFTPREKIQFQTATTFLHQLQDSPSLSALDSFVSREKIARAMKDPKSMGMLDRIAAYNLDPKEAEFLRLYNAALGTVQGLSSITRTGRPTEASVGRLKTELPSVLQSSSSADAKARIDQLLKEANTALQTNPMTVGKKGPTSKNAPPPPNGQAGPEVWTRDASGKLVKQ